MLPHVHGAYVLGGSAELPTLLMEIQMNRTLLGNLLGKKKLALATAAVAAMTAGSAGAITIDGVTFEVGAQFITTSLWETVLADPSQVLSGVGIVNQIDNTSGGGTTWINGQNSTQLTYYFTGYSVSRWFDGAVWQPASNPVGFANALAIDFTGGTISFYADSTITGTVLNPSAVGGSQAGDIAKATDGALFLKYDGVDTESLSLAGVRSGSLIGTVDGVSNIHIGNSGFGYLNVVGGDAMSHFDTDSYCVANITSAGCVVADARLDAKASTTNSGAWPLSGIASIKTDAVPEPASVALLAVGLLGMGAVARKKRR